MEEIIQEALGKGVEMHVAGELDLASELYASVIKLQPNHADANHNMGLLKVDKGQDLEALPYLQTALQADPSIAQFWLSYIRALIKLDKVDEAGRILSLAQESGVKSEEFPELHQQLNGLASVEKEAQSQSDASNQSNLNTGSQAPPQQAINQLANLYNQGQLSAVVEQAQALTEQYPSAFIVWNILGAANKGLGRVGEAVRAFRKVTELNPTYADGFNNLGVALQEQGKLKEAIVSFNTALSIMPDYAEAYNNLGNALKRQSKLDEALVAYNKAITLKPDYASALNNMATVLEEQGHLDGALEFYKKALSLKPDYAEAYNNLGNTHEKKGQVGEAIKAYHKALSLKPDYADAHLHLGFALLKRGDLKEGLDEYEWRWKTSRFLPKKRHFSQPLWDGRKSLNGKRILLWSEQGVGDTINWSSCVPLLASQADHCILECQEKLVPLLTQSFPNVAVKPENRSSDSDRSDFDFHLPMGSLYRHFISKISPDAKTDAFLAPDPVRVNFWKNRLKSLGSGPYIGISWKSTNMALGRVPNYAPIVAWSPVLTLPGVTFVNLQYKDFKNDLLKIQSEFGVRVHNFDDLNHYDDLDDVAALSAALDFVVSTKMTVPLIAAGVGTATKLATWRQSSWSNILLNPVGPSVDIFERNTWEPWDNVFNLIADDIFKQTRNWSPS